MSKLTNPETAPGHTPKDVPRERKCLRCETKFQSEGFGERICRRCKGSNAWRNAAPGGQGSSRRR